jgi:hypothetical protein
MKFVCTFLKFLGAQIKILYLFLVFPICSMSCPLHEEYRLIWGILPL